MNYQKIYDDIIHKRINNPAQGYTETHHILPKSMGGSDEKSNLVVLSAREHFICHWLLYKIHKTQAMACAWNMMCNDNGNAMGMRYTSHAFKYAREAHAKALSVANIGNTYAKGKVFSEKHKKAISESLKGRPKSKQHKENLSKARAGKKLSASHVAKIKERMSGDSNPNAGKKHSKDSLAKMSKNRKGKCTGKNHGKARKVLCVTTGVVYDTITEARKATGAVHIGSACNGKRATAGKLDGEKLEWKYL